MTTSYDKVPDVGTGNIPLDGLEPYVNGLRKIRSTILPMLDSLSDIDDIAEVAASEIVALYCEVRRDDVARDAIERWGKFLPGKGYVKKFVGITMIGVLKTHSRRVAPYTESIVAAVNMYARQHQDQSHLPTPAEVLKWIQNYTYPGKKNQGEPRVRLEAIYAEWDVVRKVEAEPTEDQKLAAKIAADAHSLVDFYKKGAELEGVKIEEYQQQIKQRARDEGKLVEDVIDEVKQEWKDKRAANNADEKPINLCPGLEAGTSEPDGFSERRGAVVTNYGNDLAKLSARILELTARKAA